MDLSVDLKGEYIKDNTLLISIPQNDATSIANFDFFKLNFTLYLLRRVKSLFNASIIASISTAATKMSSIKDFIRNRPSLPSFIFSRILSKTLAKIAGALLIPNGRRAYENVPRYFFVCTANASRERESGCISIWLKAPVASVCANNLN